MTKQPTSPVGTDVESVYARASFGHPLLLGTRPAVVVVDLSRGFTDAACPFGFELSEEIEATRAILAVAREREVPVAFTATGYEPCDLQNTVWVQKMPALRALMRDSKWAEIDQRLERLPAEPVFFKKGFSGLFGTNLASFLVQRGADTVVVCGSTTSGCIRATVTDLFQYGFAPLVAREAVGDRAQPPHEASLFDIEAKFANVVGLDEVVAYLAQCGDATSAAPQQSDLTRKKSEHG